MKISLATPTLYMTPASDTGVSHTDGVTDEAVPVFAGTATLGALVTLTDATSGLSVTARVDKYGNFVAMFAGLDAGAHAVTASSMDVDGNVSRTSNPYDIDIETQASATSTAPLVSASADTVYFAVHFNQPVSDVTALSFQLVTTGDAYGIVDAVVGSGEDYTVEVRGLGGEGTVGLAFSDDAPTDLAGNQIALASGLHPVSNTTAGVEGIVVSADASGVQGTGAHPAASGGGGVVAFISDDGVLVPGVQTTSGVGNIYVKSLISGTIVQVTNGNDQSERVQISSDGSTVAFSSLATNLVPGGTSAGLNLYVAKLTSPNSSGGQSLVPGSIQLVGELNDSVADESDIPGFLLSGDGSTIAYEGSSNVPNGTTDIDTDYLKNLKTGAQFQFATDGDLASISFDGTEVAYSAFINVPGTGGEPNPYEGGTFPPNVIQDAFVYNAVTNILFTIDGSGLLPGTNPPLGPAETPDYVTQDPKLSGDGNTVVFQLARGADRDSLFSVNLADPSVFSPVSPGASTDGGTDDDFSQTVSVYGGVIAYTSLDSTGDYHAEIYTPSTQTTTDLGGALQTALTKIGNAVVYVEPGDASDSEGITYENTLGVSASVAPIDGDDAIDAAELKQAKTNGLAVSGTTNAPAGSAVLLLVTDATGSVGSHTFNGAVGDGGTWTATIPADIAATLTDGEYGLVVQVVDASGASADGRSFTVDTVSPAQPVIPHLDPGSAGGLGQNGTPVTNTATPTIDGVTEPLSLVSLYADVASGMPAAVASARADQNGLYSITAPHLADGIQDLEVQAVDPAHNPSPFSSSLEIIVDTTPPDPPPTPKLLYYADSPDGPVTKDSSLHVIGTAEPGSDVTLVDAITGDLLATDVVVGADGTYAATTHELSDGKYEVAAYATDQAGNVGKPSQYGANVTIDTQAPDAPTIASVSGGTASDGSLSPSLDISGDAEPFSQVALLVDGVPDTIDPPVTANEDGAFDLQTTDLPPGAHTLTVTATDFAGTISDASSPKAVTISDTPVVPPGAPSGTTTLGGIVIDGPISGATVFTDTDGNGERDAGEGLAVTGTDGSFALADTGGQLIASGGRDATTGLSLSGALTSPAHSTVIDPLTTLLDAYAVATGHTPQAAQPALLLILGLDPAADLTKVDPVTAAASGDDSFLIANAKLMDSAVVYADLVAAQTGVSVATAFAASFAAMAQQAATGSLNLEDGFTTLVALASSTAAIAHPGAVLSPDLAEDAGTLNYSGNLLLDTTAAPNDSSAPLTFLGAVERVEQGQAAPQLAAAGSDLAAAGNVAGAYFYYSPQVASDLTSAVSAAEAPVLPAPVLARDSDTGASAQDDLTADTTLLFTGMALPGAQVILTVSVASQPGQSTVVGVGTADTSGRYGIAATLGAGVNPVVAVQEAVTQTVAVGSTLATPTGLTPLRVTLVTVGDQPGGSPPSAPSIFTVQFAGNSGDDATHTSLYVTGHAGDIAQGSVFSITANGTPITIGAPQVSDSRFGILTTPLANGTYTLVVTQTALDGETLQSQPFTQTVTAPGSFTVRTEAAGPISGGSIAPFDYAQPNLNLYPQDSHPNGTTDTSGTAVVPTQSSVPSTYQGNTLTYVTDSGGIELDGGQDLVTGLSLPLNLSAPPGASVITPATSLLNQADFDATSRASTVSAIDYAYENGRIDTALGLLSAVDLATADPLAMAETGDATLFLKDIELLDTAFLLLPFTQNGAAAYTANPFYTIDDSLGIFPFDGFIGGKAPAITAKPIDFTSAAEVLAWMTTYDSTPISGSKDTLYDPSVLPEAAAIIAASNAAIEAHAASATSLADAMSYALAVERVAQSAEQQALAGLATVSAAQQKVGFATLQTEYTGAGLHSAVAAALAQTVEVTSFTPASASTAAVRETFTITFSAPVGGVSARDFIVSAGAGLVGVTVEGVSPVAGSNGAAYAVTVRTGVGQGIFTLGFTPDGLTNADGSPLTTGSFGAAQSYSSPVARTSSPTDLAIGDFNGDGRPDVVTANDATDGLTLYLDQGDGSFVAEPAISTGPDLAARVVTGDFNGDGKLDALTLNTAALGGGDATVSALLGKGDGTFSAPILTDVGPASGSVVHGVDVATGDFNGDGKLDLAVLNASYYYDGDGTIELFYGNGDGTFTAGSSTDVGGPVGQQLHPAEQMVEADLNGDGKPDLLVTTVSATGGAAGLSVLLGDGHGGFTLAAQPALGLGQTNGSLIAVGDLNGDGIPDIVVAPVNSVSTETVAVLLGNGDATYQPAVDVALPLPPGGNGSTINGDDENEAVAIGDVTGDGKADVVVENLQAGLVALPGLGDGTFGPGYANDAELTEISPGLALADVNNDGRLDLVTTNDVGSNAGSSVGPGISVSLNAAQTVLPASASVTVNRAAEAQPALSQVSGGGTFTHVGNAYTLDLGTLAFGAAITATFSLANTAAAPADSFDGTFSTPTGSGFTVAGASLAQPVAAGGKSGGLTFTTNAGAPGAYSETITFAPRDATAIPAVAAAPDLDDGDAAPPPAAPVANPVAAELPAITLTVTADVVSGGVGAAILAPVPAISLPNVRVGGTDSKPIIISNTAAAPAAELDVTATAAGDATVSGSVSGLAPQASDTTSLIAGLGTATAGRQSGTITLAPVSEPSTPLTEQAVAVSGSVYRPATAIITPIAAVLHVGDAGLLSLGIANADPADGLSENLRATLTNVSGPFGATAGESTGVVSAGALSSALTVSFSTMVASLLTGSATVGLMSDGGAAGTGLDGLGTLSLPSQTAPLSVTVDNYASASLQLLSGTGALAASGTNYTLDLGTVAQGAALTEVLGVTNAASGPADLLSGHFALSDADAIGLTGFGDFAGLASGQTDGGLDVSLDTSAAGTFTRTVTLTPTGSNASGYSGALTPETLTITGTVAAAGASSGSSPDGTPVAMGSQPGTSTPSLTTPVYRFFDTIHGTHLFTQSLSEAQNILSTRPDLMEETNNFGAVNPQTDPNAQAVYRFFEATNGTHFFTASYQEYLGLTTAGSSTYRPDLTYEANSTFYEDATPQPGEVAVYRFFDTVQGTQYLTASQSEYAGLTAMGSSTYRPDLTPEGTAFYAPAGSFSTRS